MGACLYAAIFGNIAQLIAKLDAQNTEVLATTCWTLSKFSEWISQTEQAPPQRL